MKIFASGLSVLVLVVLTGCPGKSENKTIESAKSPPAKKAVEDGVGVQKPADKTTPVPPSEAGKSSTETPASSGPQPVAIVDQMASISPANTRILFVGTHAGDKPDPRTCGFSDFSGSAQFDGQNLKSLAVEIKADSVYSFNKDLTNHLKAPDFLDVREYPTIRFESSKVELGTDGRGTLTGTLTLMKGSKELAIPVTYTVTAAGFTLTGDFQVDRTEFGMDKMTDRVNKEVTFSFSVGEATDPSIVLPK